MPKKSNVSFSYATLPRGSNSAYTRTRSVAESRPTAYRSFRTSHSLFRSDDGTRKYCWPPSRLADRPSWSQSLRVEVLPLNRDSADQPEWSSRARLRRQLLPARELNAKGFTPRVVGQ